MPVRFGKEIQEMLRPGGVGPAADIEGRTSMARDPIADRFEERRKKDKLSDLAKKARSIEDLQAEEELLSNTEKVEPIKAAAKPRRNAPCPCGSGKKYKNCCGRK